ncbi:hypothetical protein E1264_00155 [Actinomadura sp. KC216]|uniref:hypothetical protein n=1 Tax=Actinomadura sp. KC216 TaxID=2530370 RepID=UPI001046F3BB|nr:hypothetical protein [Actinomadura sp. KC216]TDB91918.1 hypothetical protein E1264_00155 [Actinomadura sp. KC216]
MPGIKEFYWWDAPGGALPSARLDDDRFRNLAGLLTSDIRNDGAGLLEALMLVEWARDGRQDIDDWEGDSTAAEFRPDGVLISDLGPDPKTEQYSLDEVHEALIRYWQFIFPGTGERRNALEAWARAFEQENPDVENPQHPCLPHLPL